MVKAFARCLAAAALVAFIAGSASASQFIYQALMDGPSESPPNASPGTGFAQLIYDDVAHTMTVSASFQGLTGTTSAAHIHGRVADPPATTAGVATQLPSFTTFPLGVTSGAMPATVYDMTLASSWNPSFVTANGGTTAGAELAFIAMLNDATHPNFPSRGYFNIHTSTFPGGEIRGFLTLIPEPSTLMLLVVGAIGALVFRRR
jgi:hypothetical protein